MKKFFYSLLSIAMAAGMLIASTSCGKDDDDNSSNGGETVSNSNKVAIDGQNAEINYAGWVAYEEMPGICQLVLASSKDESQMSTNYNSLNFTFNTGKQDTITALPTGTFKFELVGTIMNVQGMSFSTTGVYATSGENGCGEITIAKSGSNYTVTVSKLAGFTMTQNMSNFGEDPEQKPFSTSLTYTGSVEKMERTR